MFQMDTLIRNKPAGMYKHFRMAVILEVTSAANVGLRLTSGDVWLFLGKLYHMERVEEIEVGHERELTGRSTFRDTGCHRVICHCHLSLRSVRLRALFSM